MGKLKALHIMCKRDTESVKVAHESVLSNRGESRRYALDRGEFASGDVFAEGGYLRVTYGSPLACSELRIELLRRLRLNTNPGNDGRLVQAGERVFKQSISQ